MWITTTSQVGWWHCMLESSVESICGVMPYSVSDESVMYESCMRNEIKETV